MSFDPILADIRFGCGLSPRQGVAQGADAVVDRLMGQDDAAAIWPIEGFGTYQARIESLQEFRRVMKRNPSEKMQGEARRAQKEIQKTARRDQILWAGQTMLRRAGTADGFRERLVAFWADHFTVRGKAGLLRYAAAPYVEDTIRPRVAGRFGDMLRAAATAPMMLHYLDQGRSAGPGSAKGRKGRGLNENLAREMLELHTLGVGGPYDQGDVVEFAELLAGLTYDASTGFRFREDHAEPGAEQIMGVRYGGDGPARIEDVLAALDDLARHPSTAAHIARKLAVHFVSDTPDPGLIDAMRAAFQASDGDLAQVYRAMLAHPMAWVGAGNVKPPLDFITSALRGLDVRDMPVRNIRNMQMLYQNPMALMGQSWERPDGPDGWPEEDSAWITPQRLAGRLQWALNVPSVVAKPLPDPRHFVKTLLGDRAPATVITAARRAETRAEGIAVILASPAFQRM